MDLDAFRTDFAIIPDVTVMCKIIIPFVYYSFNVLFLILKIFVDSTFLSGKKESTYVLKRLIIFFFIKNFRAKIVNIFFKTFNIIFIYLKLF